MTPEFSNLVNPTFDIVLGLVERIQQGERPSLLKERDRIQQELNDAEATAGAEKSGVDPEHFRLAKYALVCWIDELLTAATRNAGKDDDWSQLILERMIYGTRERAWKFFASAERARKINVDALETYYLGVVLGFEGDILDALDRARQPGEEFEIKEALASLKDRIRPDATAGEALKQWALETYQQIRDRRGGEKEPFAEPLEGDVRPLWGKTLVKTSSFLALTLLTLLGILVAVKLTGQSSKPAGKSPKTGQSTSSKGGDR